MEGSLPGAQILQGLNFPLLENANEYVVHGFTYNVRAPLSVVSGTCSTSLFSCRGCMVWWASQCDFLHSKTPAAGAGAECLPMSDALTGGCFHHADACVL